MRLIIQRVISAQLWLGERLHCKTESGLVVFVGVAKGDTARDADYLAAKVVQLRMFTDSSGKMNLSVSDTRGDLMLVSNFTLYGETTKGRRPSFDRVAGPEEARPLYDYFVQKVRESGLKTETGVFQEEMRVLVENAGPVTLICDSPVAN